MIENRTSKTTVPINTVLRPTQRNIALNDVSNKVNIFFAKAILLFMTNHFHEYIFI